MDESTPIVDLPTRTECHVRKVPRMLDNTPREEGEPLGRYRYFIKPSAHARGLRYLVCRYKED